MEYIIALIIGFIPAYIASSKGRNFGAWYIYGVLLFIVALVHSLCLRGSMKCPNCAEWISKEAKVCKFCKEVL